MDKQNALRLRDLLSEVCRLQYEWECLSRSLMIDGYENDKQLRQISSDCVHLMDSVTVLAVSGQIAEVIKNTPSKIGWFTIKTK